jgi:hypothetical protein
MHKLNARRRAERKVTLARQDAVLLDFAKRIGHHGHADFVEAVRQRYNMGLTPEYAKDLLARAGYPNA